MPVDLKAYAKGVEEQIKQNPRRSCAAGAGKMTFGERKGNGPWRDVTQDMIEHHKSPPLRTYELMLADLRARMARGD